MSGSLMYRQLQSCGLCTALLLGCSGGQPTSDDAASQTQAAVVVVAGSSAALEGAEPQPPPRCLDDNDCHVVKDTACQCSKCRRRRTRVRTAKTETRRIRAVATQHVALTGDVCPTVAQLIATKELDAATTDDPWGSAYEIMCTADDVVVSSPGPDNEMGSDDDVVAGADR